MYDWMEANLHSQSDAYNRTEETFKALSRVLGDEYEGESGDIWAR